MAATYIKLSELTRQIEVHIQQSFGTQLFWIVAEISGHKFYANQDRHYFDFVEKLEGLSVDTAKVKGKAWSGGAKNIQVFEETTGQKFTNGLQILAQVRVEFHSIHGFSLILLDIDPSFTLGNLERQRRETLIRLVHENPGVITKDGDDYITRNKLIRLNLVIQKIALIASPNSEGYNDFLHTMQTNQFGYKFHIDEYRSSVQGAMAEAELVNTLVKIYNTAIVYDCVVIVRGGGAKTDFLVFDTYQVSRAVAKFPIPVITGIGHHKDVSIVDLMSNTVTKTPTKAAEFIISHARNFEENLHKYQKDTIIKSQQLLSSAHQNIHISNMVLITNSRNLLTRHKDHLSETQQHLVRQTRAILYQRQTALTKSYELSTRSARERLFSERTMVHQLNNRLTNKTTTMLHQASEQLQILSQIIKNKPSFVMSRLHKELMAKSQQIVHPVIKHLGQKQHLLSESFYQVTGSARIISNRKTDELKGIRLNLPFYITKYLTAQYTNLNHQHVFIKTMNPRNLLKKGFAMVSYKGKIIKDSTHVKAGDQLVITMNDTQINTTVLSKKNLHE